MNYDHTQKSPLYWILAGGVLFGGVILYSVSGRLPVFWIALCFTVLAAIFACCFQTLTVRDEGACLSVRFGPIPIFGTRIFYSDIHTVEASRSSVVDGWGVHWLPGRGWTYNLWGFSCVKINTRRKIVRVGTDDMDGLVEFLKVKATHAVGHGIL